MTVGMLKSGMSIDGRDLRLPQMRRAHLFHRFEPRADYEDEHEPDDATLADALRHLIEAEGVSQTDVARGTGLSDATISHILAGHRPPSRRAIAALSAYSKVGPAVFL